MEKQMPLNVIKAAKRFGRTSEKPPSAALYSEYDRAEMAFEELCTRLIRHPKVDGLKDLMVVGACGRVGTSTVAENLAAALANGGEKVALVTIVPGDNKHPSSQVKSIHTHLNPNPHPSDKPDETRRTPEAETILSLSDDAQPDDLGFEHFTLQASRVLPPSPSSEAALSSAVAKLKSHYQRVIWDAPPVTSTVVSRMIAPLVDGVVMVVQAGQTRSHVARYCVEQTKNAGGNLLGVVLNKKKTYIPEWLYRLLFRGAA